MIRQIVKLFGSLIGLLFFYCNDCYCVQKDTTVFVTVDSIPQFKYKDCKITKECVDLFVSEHLIWPSDADIYAKIYIQCIVEKDGSLSNYKLLKSVDEKLDKASMDVVKLMPKWKPGIKNGKIVRTQIIIPVIWKLN
jgi:hypothetical protein